MLSSSEELKIAIVTTSILMFLLIVFILFLFLIFQLRKRKAQAILEKEILTAQIEIQEQLFKNVSQEIHDNVGQILSLAKLNLNGLQTIEGAGAKVESAQQLISKAIGDLRNLSRSMNGERILATGLQAAIENELTILQHTGHCSTSLEVSGLPFRLEPQRETIVFRMVQEAMTNCIKHSGAKNIHIKLENRPDEYMVCISDDGIGFDKTVLSSNHTGIGLSNMQNRAHLIDGTCAISSENGKGTTIEIILTK